MAKTPVRPSEVITYPIRIQFKEGANSLGARFRRPGASSPRLNRDGGNRQELRRTGAMPEPYDVVDSFGRSCERVTTDDKLIFGGPPAS